MTSPDTNALLAGTAATAATVGLAQHAEALQMAMADLGTLTIQQLVGLFQAYKDNPDFPQLLKTLLPQIVLPYAQAAATITAHWYSELQPGSGFKATPVVNLPQERIDKTVAWAIHAPTAPRSPEAFQPAPAELPVHELDDTEPTPDDVLSRLAGSTKRMVYDASRDTVTTNAATQGIRYARLAQPDACAFCRMLATRTGSKELYHPDAVVVDPETGNLITTVVGRRKSLTASQRRAKAAGQYVNTATASTGVLRGTQAIGEKYHDHCRCVAVPVPEGQSYDPPDYTAQWQQDYIDAVKATRDSGKTKGRYGAIDVKAVLAHMRANTDAH